VNSHNKHIIIIGGGAIGLSTAYHLGKLGCPNVLLLEKNELTSGTSWHAAGIVGPLRATQNLTTIAKYAVELFPKLEQETGQMTGYKETGGLWLSTQPERLVELKRVAAMGEMNDLHTEFLLPEQIKQRFPMINTSDLAGGMWLDRDGQVNPVDMCMAYARGARANGVEIREHAGVADINVVKGMAESVVLDSGEKIECEMVVNCAGLWARTIGELAGVNIPLQAVEHMYIVTEPIPELPSPWPVTRDMEGALYIKEDAGKLVLGTFEPNAKLWDHKSVDPKASFLNFNEDWDHIEPMMKSGINRIPRFETLGTTHFMTGPESFTPDTKQLMGRAPEVDNFYVAAGFNSLGIMSSAGVGRVMADWMIQGHSPMDLWEVDITRFQPRDNDISFIRTRIPEAVSNQFDMHWQNKQYKTGRNRRVSVWHEEMSRQGAVFGMMAGWERPLWFARDDEPGQLEYSYGNQNWWPVAQRESKMLETTGAIFELSPFTKLVVEGPDAEVALQWLCTNNIDVEDGKVVYTLMMNHHGGIEGELTVTRLADDQFLLVSASATRIRDIQWIVRNTRQFNISVVDKTDENSVLGVMGPNSRQMLTELSSGDFSTGAFPFGHSKMVDFDGLDIRASRLSFVGELGWELLVPDGVATQVFEKLLAVAPDYGVGMAGVLTMECCRMEKGYLHWGHDIGPEENPYQAGLGFAVKTNKGGGFLGLEMLNDLVEAGITNKLVQFEAGGAQPLLLHDEPIFWNDIWVGRTTSGGIGLRTGKTLCFGYIDFDKITTDDIFGQEFSVMVAGERHHLTALNEPPYDPTGSRMRA
jgi:4-methylaminobutanoate oxidase (formaldehyde-forming)